MPFVFSCFLPGKRLWTVSSAAARGISETPVPKDNPCAESNAINRLFAYVWLHKEELCYLHSFTGDIDFSRFPRCCSSAATVS